MTLVVCLSYTSLQLIVTSIEVRKIGNGLNNILFFFSSDNIITLVIVYAGARGA